MAKSDLLSRVQGLSTKRAGDRSSLHHTQREGIETSSIDNRAGRMSWPGWLPPWFTPSVAVVAGVAVVLALFLVRGSVRAEVANPLDLTNILRQVSHETQTVSGDAPAATASPSLSDFLSTSTPLPFISSFLSTPDEQSPQTARSSSPSPSSAQAERACG